MSDRHIYAKNKWIDEQQAAWRLAQGDPIQARKYFDWMMNADSDIEKGMRGWTLVRCPSGSPLDFYDFIKPYIMLVEYYGRDTPKVLFKGEKVSAEEVSAEK